MQPIIGPFNFFITTKCSAKPLSPISNFSVAVDMVFLTGRWLLIFEKMGGSSILRILFGLSVYGFLVILCDCADKCS